MSAKVVDGVNVSNNTKLMEDKIMENRMHVKPNYKCAICGESYDDVKTRMECEAKCLKQQEIEAKKVAEAKKKEEKIADEAKVDEAFATAYKLRDEFVKKHGVYAYTHKKHVTNTFEENDAPTLGDVLDFLSTIAF